MKLLAHFVPSGEGETTSILNQLQPQRWLPCAPFVKQIAFRGSICSLMETEYRRLTAHSGEANPIPDQDPACPRRTVISVTSGGQFSRTGMVMVPSPMFV